MSTTERVRAKKLAELAGLDSGPWKNAERELADVIAAERQRELDANAQRDKIEAEEFKKAHAAHAIARAEILELQRREAEKNQEIKALGEDAQAAYRKCGDNVSHPAGKLVLDDLRASRPPSRLLPPKTSAQEFLLAARVHELLVEAQNLRQQVGCHKDSLTNLERRFPALADLRD